MAPSFPLAVAASGLFGMAFGAVDIAMNAQGSAVERAYDRPLMNGMHAGWCAGAIGAGLLGTAAIAAGLSITAHLALVALLALPATVLVSRTYLPDPAAVAEHGKGTPATPRLRMPPVVYLLGVIAFCAFMVEGTVADWNGLYLRDALGAPEAVAALGYPIFEAGMLAGRLAGDRVRPLRRSRHDGHLGPGHRRDLRRGRHGPHCVGRPLGHAVRGRRRGDGLADGHVPGGRGDRQPCPPSPRPVRWATRDCCWAPVIIGFLSDLATLRTSLGIAVVLGVLIAAVALFLPRHRAAAGPAETARRELSIAA